MADPHNAHDVGDDAQIPHHPASFVLRCWVGRENVVRARLTDVRSGVNYPLADLDELSSLVQRLVLTSGPPASPSEPE
jgi:hypothetical protein